MVKLENDARKEGNTSTNYHFFLHQLFETTFCVASTPEKVKHAGINYSFRSKPLLLCCRRKVVTAAYLFIMVIKLVLKFIVYSVPQNFPP